MSSPPVRLTVSAKSDRGKTRDHNEDTFLVADLTHGTTDFLDGGRAVVGQRGSLFLVADGMGGAAAGEVASAMAADVIFRHVTETWGRSAESSGDEFIARLREAVELANRQLHLYARQHPDVRGMGTTATVVGVFGARLYLAQVGDSRAYLVRRGEAVQLTKDQSLMQRLIDAGELIEAEAEQSERRNIILQALGPDARIRVDVTYQDLSRGDILILCSDGLSGQVKREEIASLVSQTSEVDHISDTLVQLANERGGPDNITVVVVRFDGEGLPEVNSGSAMGYQVYPLPEAGEPASEPEPEPDLEPEPEVQPDPEPAAAPPPPDTAVEASAPVATPARRSGSPAAMAALVVLVLLLLFLLFRILVQS